MAKESVSGNDFDADLELEKRKISELYREIKSKGHEDAEERINWMYRNPSECVDREEYLLGRSVDKALDTINGKDEASSSKEISNIPRPILSGHNKTIKEQVDLKKKIHEDPLFAIREKEIEFRKQLLNNPVKLKEMKQMLMEQAKMAKQNSRVQRKQEKMNLKAKNIDNLLLEQLQLLSRRYDLIALCKNLDSSNDDSSSHDQYSREEGSLKSHRRKTKSRKYERSSSSDDSTSGSDQEIKKGSSKKSSRKHQSQTKKSRIVDESSSPDDSTSDSEDSDKEVKKRNNKKASRTHHSLNHKRKIKKKSRMNEESRSPDDSISDSSSHAKQIKKRSSKKEPKLKTRKYKESSSSDSDSSVSEMHSTKKEFLRDRSPSHRHLRRNHSKQRSADLGNKRGKREPRVDSSNESFKLKNNSSNRCPRKVSSEDKMVKRKHSKSPEKEYNREIEKNPNSRHHRRTATKHQDDDGKRQHKNKKRHSSSISRSGERSPPQKKYGLSTLDGSKPDLSAKDIAPYKKVEPEKEKYVKLKTKQLSQKEIDEQLESMTKNAQWRKMEREADYSKHKQEKQTEEKINDYDDSFVRKQLTSMSSKGSMAERLKSKVNTIQRSSSTMDRSFVRK